jgi:hypothetical protein
MRLGAHKAIFSDMFLYCYCVGRVLPVTKREIRFDQHARSTCTLLDSRSVVRGSECKCNRFGVDFIKE